jgi:stalled ribosome rescue protein Dom34
MLKGSVTRRKKPRGYPVAILIGLEKHKVNFWNIYSKSIRPDIEIEYEKDNYNYFESIIDNIRPKVKKGIKIIIIVSTEKKNYDLLYEHINRHQKWLIGGYELNRVTLDYLEGSAENIFEVNELIEKSILQKTIKKVYSQENQSVMKELDKRLGTSKGIDNFLFTLEEVENAVYRDNSEMRPEYILLTTDFQRRNRKRTQRLLQISQNKTIKTMVVENKSAMGSRLSQFGGLICMVHRLNE